MLKRAVESLLARGLGPVLSRRHRGRVLVLAYHNVLPEDASPGGDRSLHMSRRAFSEQLDALRESYRVVPLRDALEELGSPKDRAADGDTRRPRAVVTFDDAYRGAVTCGLEELARRDLPATVFVSPGLLGGDGFWWDRLPAEREDEGNGGRRPTGGSGPDRETLLRDLAGRGTEILKQVRRRGCTPGDPPEHALPVTAGELRDVAGRPGLTFGAHSWSHANLARLEGDELEEELVRPRVWLERELGDAFLPVLAYPYGRCSDPAVQAAGEAGYRAAFTVSGGSFAPDAADAHRLPRTNVPAGVSVDGFRLRVFGLLT